MADYPVLDDVGGTIIANEKDPNYVHTPYDRSGDYPVRDDDSNVIILTDRDPALGSAAPVISGVPTISGSTVQGQTLTANPAAVSGTPTPSRTWQWLRGGVAISGATASTYALVAADVGSVITVRQTETNTAGNSSATSAGTNTITATPVAPVISGVPTIAGSTVQGQTLTATAAGFSNTPNPTPTRTWQWLRNTVAISGATNGTYVLVAADVGATITVRQTETNSGGTANATSAATATITEPNPTITGYSFNAGTGQVSFTVDVGDTVYWSTSNASVVSAADIENAVGAINSGNNPVSSGVNNFTWSYPATSGDRYLNIVVKNTTGYSNVISVQYTFTASDTTAPTLTGATDAANGQTASTGSVSTNEANGTLFSVVTTSTTAPTAAQVEAGQDNTGSAAASSASQTVSATGVQAVNHTGLTAATQYYTHYMHKDAAGNQSTVVSASGFTTAAAGNPELLQEPGFDASSTWIVPGGCTIQNSAAEWRTAAAFSTLWNGASTGNLATVSASTSYTVAFDVANFTSGGNFQLGVTWYTSAGAAISTDEAAVAANANGTVSRVLGNSPANAAYASYRAKPWGANYNLDFSAASLKAT